MSAILADHAAVAAVVVAADADGAVLIGRIETAPAVIAPEVLIVVAIIARIGAALPASLIGVKEAIRTVHILIPTGTAIPANSAIIDNRSLVV
jgi:hypothetical protein